MIIVDVMFIEIHGTVKSIMLSVKCQSSVMPGNSPLCLEVFFKRMRERNAKKSVKPQFEVKNTDSQLQFMLKQQKEKTFSQDSTYYQESKQIDCQLGKTSVVTAEKKQKKHTIYDYFGIRASMNSKSRSRTREKPKKFKKRVNSKKLAKNQTTLEKYFPNLQLKIFHLDTKSVAKKEKQLKPLLVVYHQSQISHQRHRQICLFFHYQAKMQRKAKMRRLLL